MEKKIVYIKTEELFPHPDNPRKDLGYEMSEEERKMMDGSLVRELLLEAPRLPKMAEG